MEGILCPKFAVAGCQGGSEAIAAPRWRIWGRAARSDRVAHHGEYRVGTDERHNTTQMALSCPTRRCLCAPSGPLYCRPNGDKPRPAAGARGNGGPQGAAGSPGAPCRVTRVGSGRVLQLQRGRRATPRAESGIGRRKQQAPATSNPPAEPELGQALNVDRHYITLHISMI